MSTDAQSPEDSIETMCKQVSLSKRSILRGFILVTVGLQILDYGQLPVTSDRMVGGKSVETNIFAAIAAETTLSCANC